MQIKQFTTIALSSLALAAASDYAAAAPASAVAAVAQVPEYPAPAAYSTEAPVAAVEANAYETAAPVAAVEANVYETAAPVAAVSVSAYETAAPISTETYPTPAPTAEYVAAVDATVPTPCPTTEGNNSMSDLDKLLHGNHSELVNATGHDMHEGHEAGVEYSVSAAATNFVSILALIPCALYFL